MRVGFLFRRVFGSGRLDLGLGFAFGSRSVGRCSLGRESLVTVAPWSKCSGGGCSSFVSCLSIGMNRSLRDLFVETLADNDQSLRNYFSHLH